jgi:DNA-binding XRE family transcriptional regulator
MEVKRRKRRKVREVEKRPLLSPRMIKQARKIVRIDQSGLASQAGISRKTVVAVEAALPAKVDARRRLVLERIRRVFEQEFGLEFTFGDDPGGGSVRRIPKRSDT